MGKIQQMTFRKLMIAGAAVALLAVGATAAMAQTSAQKALIDAAKSQGTVGEQADGYVGVRTTADAELRAAVDATNNGRRAVYARSATEAGTRSTKQKADLTRLETEMTKAGVLLRSYRLAPSAKAKRLFFTNTVMRAVDGPFAETKELIGGFSVMELPSIEEAIALCRRYVEILGGTVEIDVRPIEPSEAAT